MDFRGDVNFRFPSVRCCCNLEDRGMKVSAGCRRLVDGPWGGKTCCRFGEKMVSGCGAESAQEGKIGCVQTVRESWEIDHNS